MTALTPAAAEANRFQFCAPDFDTLVDSPILVGNAAAYEFTVDGKRHLLVNEGEIDPKRLTKVLHFDGSPITACFIAGAIGDVVAPAPAVQQLEAVK